MKSKKVRCLGIILVLINGETLWGSQKTMAKKFKIKQDMQYVSSMDEMYQKYLEENKNSNRT